MIDSWKRSDLKYMLKIAQVGNASENSFPLLLLGGSVETHQGRP
jgi:hypothetical protein